MKRSGMKVSGKQQQRLTFYLVPMEVVHPAVGLAQYGRVEYGHQASSWIGTRLCVQAEEWVSRPDPHAL